VHEHIARAIYYFSVHLLFASIVGSAAWGLTAVLRASAGTKYWIWVATACNFVVPSGALVDKLWAPRLTWARPLALIGGPVWDLTEGPTAVLLGAIWMTGTFLMLSRLISRIRRECREAQVSTQLSDQAETSHFRANGTPVSFGDGHRSPAVRGVLYPRIVLPIGIDRLLNQCEIDAVLIHELAHARRRDNLIRLFYEVSLCTLWFHPLIWLAGARIALYRELSCDDCVIRHAHGQALVSALAKLAIPEESGFLQAAASSHLSYRLARLTEPAQAPHRSATLLLKSLFVAVIVASVFGTIAHTACCFLLSR
jgi:beta-lactamase regulating signal transducer with metallopeptidase domain